MTHAERQVNRKLRILNHAEASGNIAKTCRYVGIPRSLFNVWRKAYREHGNEGLKCKKPIPRTHPNQTPDEGDAFGRLLEKHPHVRQVVCGHVHRPIHAQWHGVTVSIAPSASHYVALNLGEDSPADFYLEPPTVQLYEWRDDSLIAHLSFVGEFDGPYPFFDKQGNLID